MIVKDEALLAYFRGRGRCEWCGRNCVRLEPAHIKARGMGGGSRLDVPLNLCSLCPSCHGKHHEGKEPTAEQLWACVDIRNGLEFGQAEASVRRLLRTWKQ